MIRGRVLWRDGVAEVAAAARLRAFAADVAEPHRAAFLAAAARVGSGE